MIDLFRSKEERFFFSMSSAIPSLIPELEGMEVVTVAYEPFVLRLAGVTYTPDFLIWMDGPKGYLSVLFEVKGSKKQKGYRETRIRLSESTSLYPMFVFIEAIVDAKSQGFASFEILSSLPFPYSFRIPTKKR
ncbi:MAG TPA: hypothetical protein PKC99_05925 [Anaerolineales bacterium]|nr:hypothetical protein [Anaerolineales bacterium]